MNHLKRIIQISLISIISASLTAAHWAPFNLVSNPGFNALVEAVAPRIGVDAQGNAFIVWNGTQAGTNVIKASRFDSFTQQWSTEEIIGVGNSGLPQVAVTKDGKAVAVWINSSSGNFIYSNTFDGTAWLGEQVIDTNISFLDQGEPQVGVDNIGNAIAVWQVGAGAAHVIRASVLNIATNTWGSATSISSDYGTGSLVLGQPIISVNDAGDAIVVWRFHDTDSYSFPVYRIQSTMYLSGAWTGIDEVVAESIDDTQELVLPLVVLNQTGTALATWVQFDNTVPTLQPYVIMAATRSGSWGTAAQISTLGNIDFNSTTRAEKGPYLNDIAIDGLGNGIVVNSIQNDIYGNNIIEAATFPGMIWSGSTITISNPAVLSFFPSIALDANGNGFAIWNITDNATFFLIESSQYLKASNSWQEPLEIIPGVDATILPNIGGNDSGIFFATIFQTSDFSNFTVQATYNISTANFSILKTVDNATPMPEQIIEYTIVVSNIGDEPAVGVQVTDVLPAGVAFVSSTASQGSYDTNTGIWSVGTLSSSGYGSSASLTLRVSINSGTGGQTIVNTATVLNDLYPSNNSSSVSITILENSAAPGSRLTWEARTNSLNATISIS